MSADVSTPARRPLDEYAPLSDVLASPEGRAALRRHLPHLVDAVAEFPIDISGFPIGSVLHFELAGDAARIADVLAELSGIDNPTPMRDEPREILPDPGYEDPSTPRGTAPFVVSDQPTQHRTVEVRIAGPSHGNPFVDVDLGAVFAQDATTIRVGGFYDDDGRYLIRFLPPTAGTWTFETSSTARSLDGIDGSIVVRPSTDRGPVRVADRFHFAGANGDVFRPVGTTAYAWLHQSAQLEEQTIRSLADTGFTKLRWCLFPKHYLFNHNEPQDFVFPRTDAGSFDVERFDVAFFHRIEARIADLAKIGVESEIILFHAYDRWGFADLGRAVDDRYVRYVVRRLAAFPTVWWSLANEYDLLTGKRPEDWTRLGELVRAEDPVGHPRSIHNINRTFDHSEEWVTHVSMQKNVADIGPLIDRWRDEWGKPVVLDEFGYDGDLEPVWGNLTSEEVVRRFWQVALRGGYATHGETFWSPDDIVFWSKGGRLRGDSIPRIAFLDRIVAATPAGRITPLRGAGDTVIGGSGVAGVEAGEVGGASEVIIEYLDAQRPRFRTVTVPDGKVARIDVIDTWNMTIEPVPGVHHGRCTIELPARPYIALRVTKEDE